VHTPLPYYRVPFYVQSTLIPHDIGDTDLVDLVFTNFSSSAVLLIHFAWLILGHRNTEFLRAVRTFV
jgi:hypothetical protein